MQEHHFAVTRTARYLTLGDAGTGAVRQVWFACHGYGQLASAFATDLAVLDDGTRLVVVPEALSRFYLERTAGRHGAAAKVGASWMTREDRLAEIEDHVAYLDALYDRVFTGVPRESVAVVALGFSQGTATVSRWIARGHARADHVVLWGGMLPPDLMARDVGEDLGHARLTFVLGTRDQFAPEPAIAEHRRQLEAQGVRFELVRFTGGHRLDDATLTQLAAGAGAVPP